jgi:DNA polymerase III sliding clamp (beta) subunit (PCNA family)
MKIIDSLKFVKNGYAKKDLVPKLCHYLIKDKRVTAYNGLIALSSPINLDIDIAPSAIHFHKCIEACEDTISITVEKDKIRVKSGKFKSLVKCISTEEVPSIIPVGVRYNIPSDFVDSVKKLLPIIENESDRSYSTCLSFVGQSAIATNNIVFVEHWIGGELPPISIPKKCIEEICRYGKPIEYILVSHDMIFFFYEDERWIASKLMICQLPDFSKVLNQESNPRSFPDSFWQGLERLSRFTDEAGKLALSKGILATGDGSNEDPEASIEIPDLDIEENIYFNIYQLLKLKPLANSIDFKYGKANLFFGDKLRGAIVGYRK